MKLFLTILFACILFYKGSGQTVTISERNVPIGKVLNIIRDQTGYFFGFGENITGKNTKVSLVVKNAPLKEALDRLFYNLPFTYIIIEKVIVITDRNRNEKSEVPIRIAIKGRVENEAGELLQGATISVLNTNKGCFTNSNGDFLIKGIANNSTLLISSVGYESQQYILNGQEVLQVKLKIASKGLDEAVVIAYGKTSKRLNTGNVYKVKGSEIEDQPVSNFMAALSGRVPGMLVSQTSGIPGAAFKPEIRGRASIGARYGIIPTINLPIIVDGIPFAPDNNNLPVIAAGAALSPSGRNSFDLINIKDIESIEILKDADATAIYGSRAANGVILVTTKRGRIGKPEITLTTSTGFGRITRYPDMMNTGQYVAMRKQAILNDGNTPNASNAPDLFKWDTTRNTDWKKELIGGTASIYNFNGSVSGGTKQNQYLLSTSFRKETTVFPGDYADRIFYGHGFVSHQSRNEKFKVAGSIIATHDNNNSLVTDITAYVNIPPNAPAVYDSAGNLVWQQGGYAFNNPMAQLKQPYHAVTDNILTGINISYNLFKGFFLKVNGGLNNIKIDESILQPRSSFNTFSIPSAKGTSYFSYDKLKSWVLEPQIQYSTNIGSGNLSVLVGGTYQQLKTRIKYTAATLFSNDDELTDISKAGHVDVTNFNSEYKYVGGFGRLSYNWQNKYVVNLTARRDGSSRFGKNKQFGNFGALGAGWIFSNEAFVNKALSFISFGKIRGSYGITGSDQIGDNKYLDQWIQSSSTYQGVTGLVPIQPANPYYSWEENRKLEGALELGLFNNKIYFSGVFYRNRTGNQLLSVSLPATTGFQRLTVGNYPAIVQNKGWELILQYNVITKKLFEFNSKLILTIPKNEVLSFPNLSYSPYANSGIYIGKSLWSIPGFTYTGVDKTTGLFTFKDINGDGNLDYTNDYSLVNQDPKYYGSWSNYIRLENWEFECMFEFKKQFSYNLLNWIYTNKPPGLSKSNQPTLLNNYWKKPGDDAFLQKPTASLSSIAAGQIDNFLASSGLFSDASYVRLKTASISYSFSPRVLAKLHLKKCKFYVSGNNLVIFTHFMGTDPETIAIVTLPPLRTITVGLHLNF